MHLKRPTIHRTHAKCRCQTSQDDHNRDGERFVLSCQFAVMNVDVHLGNWPSFGYMGL